MDVLKSIRRTMKMVGIEERLGNTGPQIYVMLAIHIINTVNVIYVVIDKWDDLDDRIYTLKTTSLYTNGMLYLIMFLFYWDEYTPMFDILKDINFKLPYRVTSKRQEILDLLDTHMTKLDNFWNVMIVAYASSLVVTPFTVTVIKVIFFSESFQKAIKDNLASPVPLYFPKSLELFGGWKPALNVLFYVTGYTLQSVYVIFVGLYVHISNVTSMCCTTNIEHQLKHLRLSLSEMDDAINWKNPLNGETLEEENAMKLFANYFVRHYQYTLRRFNIVNKGIKWPVATLKASASLYLCLSIYLIIQKEKLIWKVQEGVILAVWAYAVYFIDSSGQRIKSESEKLRNALFECSWTDKPQWFKKSLLISMSRSHRSVDLKPFGLISLNINSFAMTIKAAYSYFNVLYSFKSQ